MQLILKTSSIYRTTVACVDRLAATDGKRLIFLAQCSRRCYIWQKRQFARSGARTDSPPPNNLYLSRSSAFALHPSPPLPVFKTTLGTSESESQDCDFKLRMISLGAGGKLN